MMDCNGPEPATYFQMEGMQLDFARISTLWLTSGEAARELPSAGYYVAELASVAAELHMPEERLHA